jgi:hypothetical protein
MSQRWRDIRDLALRPVYPVEAIERFLSEQAAVMFAERLVERAYLRERIEQEFGE